MATDMSKNQTESNVPESSVSLASLAQSAHDANSRAPLFEDSSDATVPGNVHLLSDEAISRMLDRDGGIALVRQMAKDLAERDNQITEMRKRFEDKEKRLKLMLYDSGVSRSEVERRMLHPLNRRSSRESVLSGRARSVFSHVETLDDQLQDAMHAGVVSGDNIAAAIQRQTSQSRRASPRPGLRSDSPSHTMRLQRATSNTSMNSERPRSASLLSKWSTGLFRWDSPQKSGLDGLPVDTVESAVADDSFKTLSSGALAKNIEATRMEDLKHGCTASHMDDRKTNEYDTHALSQLLPSRTDLWSHRGAPLHYRAILYARKTIIPAPDSSVKDTKLVLRHTSSAIAHSARDLVHSRISPVSTSQCDERNSVSLDPLVQPIQHKLNDTHARLKSISATHSNDSWITPAMRDTAQAILPKANISKMPPKENSAMELATIIPDVDQPPTMLPTWHTDAMDDDPQAFTDRYGFRLFSKKSQQRIPMTDDDHHEPSLDAKVTTVLQDKERMENLQADNRSVSTNSSTPASLEPEAGRSAKTKAKALHGQASSPRPLSPETSLDKSGAVFSNEKSSARLHMLTQLDIYGADKAKQELWDNFLRKTREDRRKQDKKRDDTIDQYEDELIGVASMGTGKMAKERRKELGLLLLGGIPMAYRPKIWGELTGAYMMKEPAYYEELVSYGKDVDHFSIDQIELDLKRTMPSNIFFAGTGTGVAKLRRVLLAFSRHNPVIGYCQGMNVIAATLLLTHPTEEDAFFVLACIVEKILPARYFTPDLLDSRADQLVLKLLVKDLCPKIHKKLADLEIDLEAITFGWFLSVFTDCLPAELLFRTWDIFFLEGHTYLFCSALAILKLHEKSIMDSGAPAHVYTTLKELKKTKEIHLDEYVRVMEQMRHIMSNKGYNIIEMQSTAAKKILPQESDD